MSKVDQFWDELKQRDLIQNFTKQEKILAVFNRNKKFYVGFDPSFSSLHLGNFVVLNVLALAKKYGLNFVVVVGGMTGLIGDPSGKKVERVLLNSNIVEKNIVAISTQIQQLIPNCEIVNNATFYEHKSIIDFLREIGKFINIADLLNKEIIRNRLENGISYTEFSYSLIQAHDFYTLHQNHNVDLEIGGSDQWGNITIGIDYINKKCVYSESNSPVCGLTLKLLLKSDGTKFGKSEKGAIYLDSRLTSAYTMYQFLINQNDEDVKNLLNYLTDYSLFEIAQILKEHDNHKKARYAQKMLARNLVARIHGYETLEKVQHVSQVLFQSDLNSLNLSEIELILQDFPVLNYDFRDEQNLMDVLIQSKAFKSKTEIRNLIKQNGLSINGVKCNNVEQPLNSHLVLHNRFIIVKSGKQNLQIIQRSKI